MSDLPVGRFRERPTCSTCVISVNGWRIKFYEVTLDGAPIDDAVLDAVAQILVTELPASTTSDVQVGFCVVHRGAESVWILADLWAGDIISQHTFFAPLDDPSAFERVPAGGPTACVFELTVHAHERGAFVRHVLNPAEGPRLDDYLADTLTITG
jgi:hypothetical protein